MTPDKILIDGKKIGKILAFQATFDPPTDEHPNGINAFTVRYETEKGSIRTYTVELEAVSLVRQDRCCRDLLTERLKSFQPGQHTQGVENVPCSCDGVKRFSNEIQI